MIDDKSQAIMEAYERTVLNEQVGNTIRDVADIFTRFLIGDRTMAIRQLKTLERNPIKDIDGDGGMIDSVLDPDGNMKKWNALFGKLRKEFTDVIMKNK